MNNSFFFFPSVVDLHSIGRLNEFVLEIDVAAYNVKIIKK